MGVASLTFDTAAVEAALFRSTGVKYDGMQYGPANNPDNRSYTNKGKGVGHVYLHGADADPLSGKTGPSKKSRFKDHTTMVAVIVDILGSAEGKAALKWLDDNPAAGDGLWLHGARALPVSGAWYGYEQDGAVLKKVKTASINMRAHGDALFITSAYPDEFHSGLNPNAAVFVPSSAAA